MRRQAKAPSAGSTSSHGTSRGLFGLACLCVLSLAAFLGSSAPSAPGADAFPGQGFLPDNRAWEMVSPPGKNGSFVIPYSERTRAAADGSAIGFTSLAAFADAVGTGVAVDYLAQRSTDPDPGDNGWATHAITPRQESVGLLGLAGNGEPRYVGEFSADLNSAVFFAWSPLTDDPNVENVANLYLRTDLRTPGAGFYQLLSACPLCEASETPLPPFPDQSSAAQLRPVLADATGDDLSHVVFESNQRLTADMPAQESNRTRLYEWDHGTVRLVGRIPTLPATSCDDAGGPPCTAADFSMAGTDASRRLTPHTLSDGSDGHSRIFFTRPTNGSCTALSASSFAGNLYMRVDHTTTVQLNASEKTPPVGSCAAATALDASADGTRAFFMTTQALTDDAPAGSAKIYMYDAANVNDELQKLTVNATAGQFKLTFNAQSTADLAFDATAAQVEGALNALSSIGGAGGSITVSGGPGDGIGSSPYLIAFGGSMAEIDQPPIATAAGTIPLSGGTATATVAPQVKGGGHLTFMNPDREPADGAGPARGMIGASEDGHYAYLIVAGQLVKGGPPGEARDRIYLWHDGEITHIGRSPTGKAQEEILSNLSWTSVHPRQARVSPDGKHLLFSTDNGAGLLSAHGGSDYDHGIGACVGDAGDLSDGCRELYLYSADTDELECASCNPSGAPATARVSVLVSEGSGGAHQDHHQTHSLSDDGRSVFFHSGERLVPEDINGTEDAYAYDATTGKARLLSSGESSEPSYFIDASTDGSNVFILTTERLSGWDFDTSYDLYDARIGGGFPEPPLPPPSCQGDACQPAPMSLNDPTPASSSFKGPGNQVNNRKSVRCAKGQRKVRVRGKTRCVKRKRSKRDANSNRRASR